MKKFLYLLVGLTLGFSPVMQAKPSTLLSERTSVVHDTIDYGLDFEALEKILDEYEDILIGYEDLTNELDKVKVELKAAYSSIRIIKWQLESVKAERDSMKANYDKATTDLEKMIRSDIYLKAEASREKQEKEIYKSMLESKEQLSQDLQEMLNDARAMSRKYLASLKKLRLTAFKATFRISAVQEGRIAPMRMLGFKRITGRLPLNTSNDYEVKAQKIERVYIEALCAEEDALVPDYYFTIEYFDTKNQGRFIFGTKENPLPLPTSGGYINFPLNHDWKPGSYRIRIMYEEDEQMIPQITEYFKL